MKIHGVTIENLSSCNITWYYFFFFNILQHEIWYFLVLCFYPGSNIVALITVIARNVKNKISENDEIDFSTILRLVSMYRNDHYYTLQLAGRFSAIVLIISI